MKSLRCLLVVPLAAIVAGGQLTHQAEEPKAPKQPEAMIRSLYTDVVARHPVGIPDGIDKKIFDRYLSKALLHKIELATACGDDWHRQNPDRNLKPPFDWLESGLFSGDNEQASPRTFHIEKTEMENDGSHHVFVRLTWGSHERPWIWQVAAVAVKEDGHFVIDDVIYLKDKNRLAESRLSEYLSAGCDGPRWVGYTPTESNSQ